MDRSSRRRISKIEQVLSAARKERAKRLEQRHEQFVLQARRHATAVAAIVLSGRPRINEPLLLAWERALQHYGINVKEPGRLEDQFSAAQQLFPVIIGNEKSSEKFSKIFGTAPIWLLQFARMFYDAGALRFQLRDILSVKFKWGTVGYESSWPRLPLGMMTDGDPLPEKITRAWPLPLRTAITIAEGGPPPDFEDENNPSPEDIGEEDESNLSADDLNLKDFLLFCDLVKKPESEWSRPEMRRMRKFSERLKAT
jgi:hypothetical protein